ncbi:MAG: response regulator [Syntrophothermus sp.]|uniref:response regulator n=1 Tax=Syntrophothermus sp. TaxID=2736299 RepID=UPI002579A79B|nr:response regulator [Syntrophothermus sp.]NSW82096.1 response regulator [Syntrophothermus sp.]
MARRMLVVDDQKGIRRLLEELFKQEGFEVTVAADGRQAVEEVRKSIPDIVLMDMKMPNMNGIEASEEILNISENIPIILMTAYGEIELVEKSQKIGVRRYIVKPFDISVLREMVAEELG